MLNIVEHGTPQDRPPLLIAHGLYGSARNWGVIAKRVEQHCLTVDMRNHGASPWYDSHSYPDLANDLAQVIEAHGVCADVVGHSMGGKAVMMLALTRPDLIRRAVIADIAPVTYGHSQQPMIDAMRAIDLSAVATRGDADRQLQAHVDDAGVRAFLLQSLDVKAPAWRLNLDVLSREMAKITGWPEGDFIPFEGDILFLSGGRSDYVRPEHRPAIKALFPNAKFAKIPQAGHWLHADTPREFVESLKVFLG
mgnify:FL=1